MIRTCRNLVWMALKRLNENVKKGNKDQEVEPPACILKTDKSVNIKKIKKIKRKKKKKKKRSIRKIKKIRSIKRTSTGIIEKTIVKSKR